MKNTERRGRPKLQPKIQLDQYQEVITHDDGVEVIWDWDLTKSKKGPIKSTIKYPKEYKHPKPEIDSNGKSEIVMVFKTSERKNAPIKMRTWSNKNIDTILRMKNIGVPEGAVILELGMGKNYYEEWSHKYKVELKLK